MKKRIFLATVIFMMASSLSFAQSDGFFDGWNNSEGREVNGEGFDMPGLPAAHGLEEDSTPLGTGLLILTALGAGYAVTKRKDER